MSSSLFKQKTQEIEFLIAQANKNQKEYKSTVSAIQHTIAEIESIIKQKIKTKK